MLHKMYLTTDFHVNDNFAIFHIVQFISYILILYSIFFIQGSICLFSINTAFQESPVNMNTDKQMQGHEIHAQNW